MIKACTSFHLPIRLTIALIIFSTLTQFAIAADMQERSALIIGIGHYNGPAEDLKGVPADIEMASTIAKAMGVPDQNITIMRDQAATKKDIMDALKRFGKKAADGGRVFIYYSGHGTRYFNPFINSCEEGLLTYDYETITNREMAEATKDLNRSVDKSILMVDTCHSGGVLNKSTSRSLTNSTLVAKFASKDKAGEEVCTPVNYKTRSLFDEAKTLGAIQENIVFISSARPDEVSWDEPGLGGIATQAIKECLLGSAKDLNSSGAVSLEEIRQCAQIIMDKKVPGPIQVASHVTIRGNRNLIPIQNSSLEKVRIDQDNSANMPEVGSLATLQDIESQRNPQRIIDVKLAKNSLKINQDYLNLKVKSNFDGYLYLVLLGSDQKSFYILFPNRIDENNQIKAGQTITIPADTWRIKAAGPAGIDHLLVMVSDTQRDLNNSKMLTADPNSPFVYALNNMGGRTSLINYLTGKGKGGTSEKYGAKILSVTEKL